MTTERTELQVPKGISTASPYYQDDSVTIYHDCREVLEAGLFTADLVITDPPLPIPPVLAVTQMPIS